MPNSAPRSPDVCAIQKTAHDALQSKHVGVEKLGRYLYRTYRLTTSHDFFYILRARPTHNVKLLRHEEGRLEAEACALRTLSSRPDIITARLIEYSDTAVGIGSSYLISGPFGGSVFADVEPSLSRHALASIDHSLGEYVRMLSSINGTEFGPVRHAQGSPGSHSWAKTFTGMLESVLRDGEDALINLPYEGMRDLLRRHRASLDKITQPKLVLLEVSGDENVMVDPRANRVTGVVDFSSALWGDPFVSNCFYKPTASFAEGFGRLPNGDSHERTRQYLYVLFHSLLAVVRHCYRPSQEGDELEARRDLTTAMRHLNALPR